MPDNITTIKPFLPLYIDAVLSLKSASEQEEKRTKLLLIKSTIIHCSFAVEALANNFLQFLIFSKPLSNSIDKVDTIAKIELFSVLMKKGCFDRGQFALQVLTQLIKIRNNYVHPKIQKMPIQFTKNNPNENLNEYIISKSTDTDNKSVIHIPYDPKNWTYQHAYECLSALTTSIDTLLIDLLKLEQNSLTCMFFDRMSIDGLHGPIVNSSDYWLKWLLQEANIIPRFYVDHISQKVQKAIGKD